MTIQQGWECPRCNTIYAPWMPSCVCKANKITGDKPFIYISHEGPHDFSTVGRCVVCGFQKPAPPPPATTGSGGSGNQPGEQNVF